MALRAIVGRWAENGFKRVAYVVPPGVTDLVKYLLGEWEYVPEGWRAAAGQAGWSHQSVAALQEAHWPTLQNNLRGPGPLGVSHYPWSTTREDRSDHNAMMSYGYVLARATRQKDRLSVLDWGGGIGHYYAYARALLPEVAFEYHCLDLPGLCRVGRRVLPEVHFYDRSDDLPDRRYDLVLSSSALHYFEDWRGVLRRLAGATGSFLYVARLQTIRHQPSFVVVQRPHRHGYDTEYLSWFVNRDELQQSAADAGLDLIREFVFAEDWVVRRAPEKGTSRGFLFRRTGL